MKDRDRRHDSNQHGDEADQLVKTSFIGGVLTQVRALPVGAP